MKRSNHIKTPTTDDKTTETPSRLNIEVPLDEVRGGRAKSDCLVNPCVCVCPSCKNCQSRCGNPPRL